MNDSPADPSREPQPSREPKPSREDVLAAKLRENLHRRKAQSRALDNESATESDSPELPKPSATR
jgi:hypothetical protein